MKNGGKAKAASRRGREGAGVPGNKSAGTGKAREAKSRTAGNAAEAEALARIQTVPTILELVLQITQMRFAAVARVTHDRWIACAVLDRMDFGLEAGGDLEAATTLCSEVRDQRQPIVVEHASRDEQYCGHPAVKKYGIESYIAVPIILKDGEFFGTLCAMDSRRTKLSNESIAGTMAVFAELIATELSDSEKYSALVASENLRRESEHRVRAVTDAMPGLISYVDPDYRYKFVNRAYSDWFGIDSRDIVGKTLAEVLGGPAFERLKPYLDAALEGRTEIFESEIEYRSGGTRFIRASYTPDLLDGKVRGIFVGVTDVSDAKRAEAALRNSEERYRAFIGRSGEGIWRFELDEPIPTGLPAEEQVRAMFAGAYLAECNDALARQYGLDNANELINARLTEFLIEDDPRNREYLKAFVESGYSLIDAESHEKDIEGNDKYFLNNLIGIVEDGKLVRAWGTQRDVTDSKRAQIDIDRYRILSMQARDIILFLDKETGNIVEANDAAVKAYGYDRESLLGMNIRAVRAPETLHLVEEQYRAADQKGIQFETIHIRRDGTRFPVEVSSSGADIGDDRFLVSIVRDISDRKASQEALNHNQLMLRLAMQSSQMGVWERDLATETVMWSEELERIFGLEPGSFDGTVEHFMSLVYEEDRESLRQAVSYALENRRGYRVEFRFHHADGSVRWMEGRGEAVYSEKGEPVRLYGIGIDITDRKKAERALRESEERLRLAIDISRTSTFDIDLLTDAVRTDELGREIYGWEKDEPLTFSKIQTQFHPDDKEHVIRRVGEAFDPEGPGEFEVEQRIIRRDGEIRWIRVRGRAFFEGQGYSRRAVRCMGTYIDITNQKRAEERAARAADEMRLVTDSVPALIAYVDQEQRYRFVNKAYEEWFGQKRDDIHGRRLVEVIGEEAYARLRPYVEAALAGERVNFEAEIPYKDEVSRFVHAEYVPDVHEDGSVAGYFALVGDISERRRTEADREFLLDIAETIRLAEDEEELITKVVADIGRHLHVSRSLFMEVDPQKGAGIIHNDYRAAGLEPLRGAMPLGGFSPVSIEMLRTGHTLVNDDTKKHPRTAEYYATAYKPLGMDAFVGVPLLREGKWVSLLGVLHNQPRHWTPAEVSLLEVVAERAWLGVEKLRGEAQLRNYAETFKTLVEEAPFGVYVVDSSFRLRSVNAGSQAVFAGIEPLIGRDFAEVLRIVWPEPFATEAIGHFKHTLETGEAYLAPTVTEHRHNISRTESYDWQIHRVTLPDGTFGAVCYFYDLTQQKQIEDALRESEERFRTMADSSPMLVWQSNTENHGTWFNRPWLEFTGRTMDEEMGFGWMESVHPDDRERAVGTCQGHLERREPFEMEFRMRRYDDEYRWVLDRGAPMFEPGGRFVGYIGSCIDITDRKAAEEALRVSEERVRALVNQATGGISQTDSSGRFTFVNDRYCEIVGYSRDELLQMRMQDITDPQVVLENVELYNRLWSEGTPFVIEKQYIRKDGSRVWVNNSVAPVVGTDGKPESVVCVTLDITERKLAEEKVRRANERFRIAEEASRGFVYDWDIRTDRVARSDGFSKVLGYEPGEIEETGEAWRRLIHPDDLENAVSKSDARLAQGLDHIATEYRVRHKSGSWIWVLDETAVILDPKAPAARLVGSTVDITERKLTEINQEFLFRFGELIRDNPDPYDLVEAVASALGKHLELDRCFFNEIDQETDISLIRREYRKDVTATPMIGTVPLSSRSPITREETGQGRTVVVSDVGADPRTADHADAYLWHGIRSYIAVPLTRAGEWAATLVASAEKARPWADWEIRLVQTIADRTWQALERNAAERALQESEERYRAVVESQSEMLCRFRVDGTILFVNAAYARARGTTADELLKGNFWDFVSGADQASVRGVLEQLSRDTPQIQIENRFETVNGERWTLWTNRSLSFDADGRPLEVQSTGIDITDRKLAEEKIRESEERYRNLADAMPQLVWTADPDGSVDYYNSLAANYEGIGYDESTRKWNWELLVHPDDLQATADAWRESQTSGTYEFEHRVKMKDGSYRWHLSRATLSNNSDAYGGKKWFGTATDIHENKLAQEAVVKAERRAAEEYFEMLSRIVPLAEALGTARDLYTIHRAVRDFVRSSMPCSAVFISFFDEKSRLRTAAYAWGQAGEVDISLLPPIELTENGGPNSQAVYQRRSVIVDRYMEEMKDRPHIIVKEDGIDPNSSLAVPMMVMDRVIGTIEVQAYENNAFGQEHVIALEMVANLAAVAIENVRLIEIEAKARLDAEAANRMKDEFLSILSHELRTPLNAMLGWVRMLRAGILDAERTAKAMEVIERNTRQQSSLIEDLLDVSRIISGRMRIEKDLIDVAAVVAEVADSMRPLATGKEIAFEFNGSSEPLFTSGDSVRLHQVVTNLIQNAVKFTPPGGRIEVSIAEVRNEALITISDTGVGIGSDFLPHIFDRFSQADASTRRSFTGLGLGLTIVRTIVELHGGRIAAESAGENRGSVFTVTLPLAESFYKGSAAAEVAPSLLTSHEPRLQGLNVLVVDDDLESLVPLQVFLEQEKASVAMAASAAEAQTLLKDRDFDLLISDIGMPSVDGYQFIQDIRRSSGDRKKEIPAIALTAYVSADDRQKAMEAGFQEHVSKPLDFDTLMAVIKRLLKYSE